VEITERVLADSTAMSRAKEGAANSTEMAVNKLIA